MKPKKPRRRALNVLGVGCATLAVCGFGGFFTLAKMFRDDVARLPSDLERIHQMGFPLTAEELTHLSKVPDCENAAPYYQKALRKFADFNRLHRTRFVIDFSDWIRLPTVDQAKVTALRPIINDLKVAVEFPKCSFNEHWEFGPRWASGELLGLQSLAAEVSAVSRFDLSRGQVRLGLDESQILISLANTWPTYVRMHRGLTSVAIQQSALSNLVYVLRTHPEDPAVLDEVERIAKTVRLPSLHKLLETQLVLGRILINKIKSLREVNLNYQLPTGISQKVDDLFNTPGVRPAFEAKYVKACLRYFEALPKDTDDWNSIRDTIIRLRKQADSDLSPDNSIVKANPPIPYRVPQGFGIVQSDQRMVLVMVKLLREKLKTHRFPVALPTLGQTSIDPFTKRPFQYIVKQDGFRLTSAGSTGWPQEGIFGGTFPPPSGKQGERSLEFPLQPSTNKPN